MIQMSVTQNHTSDIFFFSFQITYIRNDIINSWHILFWELNSHIQNDDVSIIFKHSHIASHFFISAHRCDTQVFTWRIALRRLGFVRFTHRLICSFHRFFCMRRCRICRLISLLLFFKHIFLLLKQVSIIVYITI